MHSSVKLAISQRARCDVTNIRFQRLACHVDLSPYEKGKQFSKGTRRSVFSPNDPR